MDIQNYTFSIGFEWKRSVDMFVSGFCLYCHLSLGLIQEWVRGFASHQCKFHFDSMYGGLDAPYGSNNMKTAKKGSLDV